MTTVETFGLFVLVMAMVGLAAVLSNQLSERLRVPAPAIFLLCAAAASDLVPRLGEVRIDVVEQVVTVALAVILFNGGMHIGWRRFRPAALATVWIGVVGTLATAGALALCAHLLFGLHWRSALLVGIALAPTDPAVVFSVLGRREVAGRSGVLLEGESGANDPVGIALMVALLAAGSGGGRVVAEVTLQFGLQMLVGLVVGAVGGRLLLWLMRRLPLPSEGLYPLQVLAGALAIYGAASAAHGSGFLAVFVGGILIGDERAPYKGEIRRFHAALASLAEIIAFLLLGLTIHLADLPHGNAWLIGLVLAVLLVLVIRPLLVGLLLWPLRLRLGERLFVLWTGLKGAVPILLGAFIVGGGVAEANRLYGIIFTVVAFSVIVQGGLVPTLARRLEVPLRTIEPEPWSLGVRFRREPEAVHRGRVTRGSPADGATIAELPCGEDVWVSLVIREGHLIPVRADTRLQVGDEVVILADPSDGLNLSRLFAPRPSGSDAQQ
ncbi:MAG TPA: potassium/proton antiporter [Actinomycetota bacterium]|jgi:cell volume regulation protein A|nr:potassium/proton antiporter [Actinomycetota bacterium]